METRTRTTADRHDMGHKAREHARPVIRLLGAHRKPKHRVQALDAQMLRQQLVLRAHAVAVVEVGGEVGRVGGAGGFAVAEHGDHDDVVGGESAAGGVRVVGVGGLREGEGGVDEAAVAGGD